MLDPKEFFTVETMTLVVPVVVSGAVLITLGSRFLMEKLMPWKEIGDKKSFASTWGEEERRLLNKRRTEERQARAREAVRRGDPDAMALVGRRQSDVEDFNRAMSVSREEAQS
jgi:hypothetical protein